MQSGGNRLGTAPDAQVGRGFGQNLKVGARGQDAAGDQLIAVHGNGHFLEQISDFGGAGIGFRS